MSAAAGWAIGHDPIVFGAAVGPAARPTVDPQATKLRAQVHRASAAYSADRHRLLALQRQIDKTGRQVAAQRAANAARVAAAQAAIPSWSSGSSSSGTS
ncbi:MAG TPA: hypothetical protein VLK34_00375, partial [Nocardioidaceae bacterium]|nr:hypothetical protein [Nocardioidaceae bacterium]